MNLWETRQYQGYRESVIRQLFQPENRRSLSSGKKGQINLLGEGWQEEVQSFEAELPMGPQGQPLNFHGTWHQLTNEQGQLVYHWYNLDDDSEFCQRIQHSNGHTYLIFREDLYGYGVLELDTLREFHFFPAESSPLASPDRFRESFIWTGVDYDPDSNLLAVIGCYWAAPFSIAVLDFSHPMEERRWVDLSDYVEGGYDVYDDLTLEGWTKEGLGWMAYNYETEETDRQVIPHKQLREWLE